LSKDVPKYGEAPPEGCDGIVGAAQDGLVVRKLLLWCGDDVEAEMKSFRTAAEEKWGGAGLPFEVVNAVPHQLEVVPSGVHKGTACLEILVSLGLPKEAAVAFGDGFNDIPMFETIGRERSVAMRNAVDAARDAAAHITSQTNTEAGLPRELASIFGVELPHC